MENTNRQKAKVQWPNGPLQMLRCRIPSHPTKRQAVIVPIRKAPPAPSVILRKRPSKSYGESESGRGSKTRGIFVTKEVSGGSLSHEWIEELVKRFGRRIVGLAEIIVQATVIGIALAKSRDRNLSLI
jgi:hypothetical protein